MTREEKQAKVMVLEQVTEQLRDRLVKAEVELEQLKEELREDKYQHTQLDTYDDQGIKWTLKLGDVILDDLTGKKCKIVKLTKSVSGSVGVWLDNEYLKGGRHPWEISKSEE